MFDEPYFVFYDLRIFLCFYQRRESYVALKVFSQTFEFFFKFFHQLFDYKMVVIVSHIAENHRNFIFVLSLKLQILCVYNDSDHGLFHNFC